jgi:selenocysteine lyase/cysteine desulfurase
MQSRRIYLDQAATSWPKPIAVTTAVEHYLRECGATSGRGTYASARTADQWVTSARHNLAKLLGARDAADVAFCSSGTHALNAAISGLLRAGDHVVTTAIEHNSVLRPLQHWRRANGITLEIAPSDDCGLAQVPQARGAKPARLVVVSHASNVTGRIQDLSPWRALADELGALFVVDASQTAGYVAIDMQRAGIDVLVSAGHKGLGAIAGTGFLIARPEIQSQLQPLMWGGTGVASEQLDALPVWPQSIEVGNLNLPAIVSIATAAEHWLRHADELSSWRRGLAHVLAGLRQRFTPSQLRIVGHEEGEPYLPVVSLLPSEWDIHEAAAVLDANFGIEMRAGFHCAALVHEPIGSLARGGTLRMSLGHGTSLVDLDDAVHSLSAMLA